MKVQSTFYPDFISKTVGILLITPFITKKIPKWLIFDAFTLLICGKNVANYALLRCKTLSLKIWLCKNLDKYHVCWLFSKNVYLDVLKLFIGHWQLEHNSQFMCPKKTNSRIFWPPWLRWQWEFTSEPSPRRD